MNTRVLNAEAWNVWHRLFIGIGCLNGGVYIALDVNSIHQTSKQHLKTCSPFIFSVKATLKHDRRFQVGLCAEMKHTKAIYAGLKELELTFVSSQCCMSLDTCCKSICGCKPAKSLWCLCSIDELRNAMALVGFPTSLTVRFCGSVCVCRRGQISHVFMAPFNVMDSQSLCDNTTAGNIWVEK